MMRVDQFSKRAMFIRCRKDMTADNFIYVFFREVITLKRCPEPVLININCSNLKPRMIWHVDSKLDASDNS